MHCSCLYFNGNNVERAHLFLNIRGISCNNCLFQILQNSCRLKIVTFYYFFIKGNAQQWQLVIIRLIIKNIIKLISVFETIIVTSSWDCSLKGHVQVWNHQKSLILFWLINMTIWCKHVHRLEMQKNFNFCAGHLPARLDIETKFPYFLFLTWLSIIRNQEFRLYI